MKIIAGQPKIIASKTGHFWFPKLHQLNQHTLCMVATTADVAQGYWPVASYLSDDQGNSWNFQQPLNYSHSSTVNKEQQLLLLPYEFWPKPGSSNKSASALGQMVSLQTKHLNQQSVEVNFIGFPRPLEKYHQDEICLWTSSKILHVGKQLITVVYGRYKDDTSFSLFCLSSTDEGFNWVYQSCIADASQIQSSSEGASEADIVVLKNGGILCIFRVGSGEKYVYHKCYSADAGKSWSKPEGMQGVFSVEPQIVRLANGILVLAGGRPGLFLWICTDGLGTDWQRWDLAKHHNQAVEDKACLFGLLDGVISEQTTSYLSLLELDNNRLLICYDRLANAWDAAPGPWGKENIIFSMVVSITNTAE